MASEIISNEERELAKEVADFAMVATWDKAISRFALKYGLKESRIIEILNEATDYNDKADPAGRIHALEDWKRHKQTPEVELASRVAIGQKKS